MKLSEVKAGGRVKILSTSGEKDKAFAARLKVTGIVAGAELQVIAVAPFGSPIAVKTRDIRLAVSRAEAENIAVEYVR